jgi:hypothetical protein
MESEMKCQFEGCKCDGEYWWNGKLYCLQHLTLLLNQQEQEINDEWDYAVPT